VDSKLLLVAHGSRLWLVDQHAADERVQLEALQQHLAADLARALVQGGEAGQQQQQQQQEQARLLQSVVPDASLVSGVGVPWDMQAQYHSTCLVQVHAAPLARAVTLH
jgi:hypothetical protein